MIFNQFEFLFLFLPLVLIAFYMPGARHLRPFVLLISSFIFYTVSGVEHALTLLFGIIWVYAITRSEAIILNKWRLAFAIIPPLLALGYYKYLAFFLGQFINLDSPLDEDTFDLFSNIILPAGISFFTFQLIAFAIDRFSGDISASPNLVRFALYISFFPQLVAGPILRFEQVQQALSRLCDFQINTEAVSRAIVYITVGLAAKVLIADTLDTYQTPYVASPEDISAASSTFVLFAYSFQIYFDFYGYSMIAIGLGALFGFTFPKNFDRPYEAANPQDFWRRWHITLSFWIRDYLDLPLGGNKSYIRNILIIFAACGLWHGAGWSFIVWGLFHAGIVIAYNATSKPWEKLPHIVQIALTFLLESAGWTLFQFDFDALLKFWASFVSVRESTLAEPTLGMWGMVLIGAIICFGVSFEKMAEGIFFGRPRPILLTLSCSILMAVVFIFITSSSTFIYFRF